MENIEFVKKVTSPSSGISVRNSIENSLKISAPSWPLQNTVAVNPFWFLRHQNFHDVLSALSLTVKTPLYMPFPYYRNALKSGEISRQALEEAIATCGRKWEALPRTIEAFMLSAATAISAEGNQTTLSSLFSGPYDIDAQIKLDIGKYASAFLDERQAIAVFPWADQSFLSSWLEAQKNDRSMSYLGLKKFTSSLRHIKDLGAEDAISLMLRTLGISDSNGQLSYMQALTASMLGWFSQFKYVEWQKSLGYPLDSKASATDLLAVRMAYDYGVYSSQNQEQADIFGNWLIKLNHPLKSNTQSLALGDYQHVLQLALELSYQKKIVPNFRSEKSLVKVKAQVLFCIDVRSEMIRRNIELEDNQIETIGFAGFFGVPFDYCSIDESKASHRLPVLLTPAFKVNETKQDATYTGHDIGTTLIQVTSFFRNLRKNPLSSFLYVELFGALYIEKALKRTFLTLANRISGKKLPNRFAVNGRGPNQGDVENADGTQFNVPQQIGRAEAVLRHMGLVKSFAPLVIILGHGSATTNNAFGSSLDCGACGGHAGDINARFLADLLNDSKVRVGLLEKGIEIPEATRFIAGVHETVTDEIFILEPEKVSVELRVQLNSVLNSISTASRRASQERLEAKSVNMDSNVGTRSTNWSEVRPEWGLAGNACFIVAPRSRTKGYNLESRSFLHDYDWNLDKEQGYMTLELIMTAPMVVTNWINLQYYASTVSPSVYGSGNKILHNLVNETGVYEGNGGDLRVGLPLQSVHDGQNFVHQPLRLSVFIEAPREQIELLIKKHEVVKQLIDNEWLHLVHIDPSTLKSERRLFGGSYVAV